MSLRKALNVLLVAFWVCAQTAMAFGHFGHSASDSSAHGMHKAAEAHKSAKAQGASSSDCLNHAQSDDEPKSHHSGSSLDQCCSAACSIVGPFAMFELNVDSPSRDFAVEFVHAPMAINQGLPTPPPNTTF